MSVDAPGRDPDANAARSWNAANAPILVLPPEVLEVVVRSLLRGSGARSRDIGAAAATCTAFYDIVRDDGVWLGGLAPDLPRARLGVADVPQAVVGRDFAATVGGWRTNRAIAGSLRGDMETVAMSVW